jgi:hypothetical protein
VENETHVLCTAHIFGSVTVPEKQGRPETRGRPWKINNLEPLKSYIVESPSAQDRAGACRNCE